MYILIIRRLSPLASVSYRAIRGSGRLNAFIFNAFDVKSGIVRYLDCLSSTRIILSIMYSEVNFCATIVHGS